MKRSGGEGVGQHFPAGRTVDFVLYSGWWAVSKQQYKRGTEEECGEGRRDKKMSHWGRSAAVIRWPCARRIVPARSLRRDNLTAAGARTREHHVDERRSTTNKASFTPTTLVWSYNKQRYWLDRMFNMTSLQSWILFIGSCRPPFKHILRSPIISGL